MTKKKDNEINNTKLADNLLKFCCYCCCLLIPLKNDFQLSMLTKVIRVN